MPVGTHVCRDAQTRRENVEGFKEVCPLQNKSDRLLCFLEFLSPELVPGQQQQSNSGFMWINFPSETECIEQQWTII